MNRRRIRAHACDNNANLSFWLGKLVNSGCDLANCTTFIIQSETRASTGCAIFFASATRDRLDEQRDIDTEDELEETEEVDSRRAGRTRVGAGLEGLAEDFALRLELLLLKNELLLPPQRMD
jgi:hypothetical protein